MASIFSRAARFLKLSKSAVVRSRRSQFSSALAARFLRSAICPGVSTADSSAGLAAASASGVSVLSLLIDFLRPNIQAGKITDARIPGNGQCGQAGVEIVWQVLKIEPGPGKAAANLGCDRR